MNRIIRQDRREARRVYISGPMSGVKDLNRQAFMEVEKRLREQGEIPINPHRFPEQKSYQDYLALDLEIIAMAADAIALLSGWEQSPGSKRELQLALELDLDIIIFEEQKK